MEQLPQKLQTSLPVTSEATANEISIYGGELNTHVIVENIARIKKAFPALHPGFYDMLSVCIKDEHFCDERLNDAVMHVIKTCPYPTPTIANFISYDKTIKFKTHDEMCRDDCWDNWLPVRLPDRPKVVWIFKNDIALYKLEKYTVK